MKKIRAKKNLGQHFLDDLQIAQQISDLIKSDNNPNILEVGPGTGALTQFLVKKTNNIKCVEIDHDCILLLKKQFYEISNNIIEGDFLKLNLQKIFRNPYIIIGNFPYNISTQILFHILEYKDLVHQIIGMFQKEVAERLVSKKGKNRGVLTILMEAFYDSEYCFTVNEDVFIPPPKIKTGVIKFTRNNRKKLECNTSLFLNIIKSAFNQKRKTLRNALKSFSLDKQSIEHLLQKRAEELSVDDFIKITFHAQKI